MKKKIPFRTIALFFIVILLMADQAYAQGDDEATMRNWPDAIVNVLTGIAVISIPFVAWP